jgi:hypothetical protein
MRVFEQALYLDLPQPTDSQAGAFSPGSPEPNFRAVPPSDRLDFFSAKTAMDEVAGDMDRWMTHLDRTQIYGRAAQAGLASSAASAISTWVPVRAVTQQSYSRGLVSERIFYDMWTALAQWEESLAPAGSLASADEQAAAAHGRLAPRRLPEDAGRAQQGIARRERGTRQQRARHISRLRGDCA